MTRGNRNDVGLVKEQNLEMQFKKQMGCMAGFLQIFDRHHILTGKRLYSAKRLPLSPVGETTSESEKSATASPEISGDMGKLSAQRPKQTPEVKLRSPLAAAAAGLPPKSPLPLPIFELKDGSRPSWKFSKEAPRLSLDSRATTDAKGSLHPKSVANQGDSQVDHTTDGGQQRRSPSVIAKLMGLEPLPNSSGSEPEKTPELRRSASESRVSKDLFQSRFVSDASNFHSKQQYQSHPAHFNNAIKDNASINTHYVDPRSSSLNKSVRAGVTEGLKGGFVNSTSPWRAPQPRKSFFDSGDVFPEPKQTVSICGEIEKRLRRRGIDEPSKDLETLKHILEALQLKGLLHCKPPPESQQNKVRRQNFVYDETPIVLMKPSRSSASTPINRRLRYYLPPNARNQVSSIRRSSVFTSETSPSPSPRRERNSRSPTRSGRSQRPTTRAIDGNANPTRSGSPVKSRSPNVQTQRRANESVESRKASPVHSPKLHPRKFELDRPDRTPKSMKTTSEIHQKEKITTAVITEDEYSSISGSSITTSTGTEAAEYKEGKNLLERCDQLLHSIAELAATDTQPSPVSVLDSFFYKDELLTPSPVAVKRNIDPKDRNGELDEEIWSPVISPIQSKCVETSDDCDFIYVSDIIKASHYLPQDSDIFVLLEKQQYLKGNNVSEVSRIQRKLIFDTINEIVDRNKRLPPWKAVLSSDYGPTTPPLDKVWSEFQRIQEREAGEDLFESICSILKKDLDGDGVNGWGDSTVEMSGAVLDIERLIFKDMVCEIIGDLSVLASRGGTLPSSSMMPRRKLVF